jgi:hypothetical protein
MCASLWTRGLHGVIRHLWRVRAAQTRRHVRWPCGRPARRRAAGRLSGFRGRRWPGGCGDRKSLRPGLAKAFYFADVSFAFVGVSPTDAAQSRRLGLVCILGTPGPGHGLGDRLVSWRRARTPRASGLGLPSLSARSARSARLRQ